jgi:small subunit ribosomal protein S2
VALIDTDSNPDLVDLPIPGNDDGIRSIDVILRQLADAVLAGKKLIKTDKEKDVAPPASGTSEPVAASASA